MNLSSCEIRPLASEKSKQIVASLSEPQERTTGWLLARCDDGVAWAKLEGGLWCFAPTSFREFCAKVTEGSLQELRIFDEHQETLIWRSGGSFLGRVLTDSQSTAPDEASAPLLEYWIVLGDRILKGPEGGFTVVGDRTGSRHAVPLECTIGDFNGGTSPLTLLVKHYFAVDTPNERNPATGVVRVAATRLVKLLKGPQHV